MFVGDRTDNTTDTRKEGEEEGRVGEGREGREGEEREGGVRDEGVGVIGLMVSICLFLVALSVCLFWIAAGESCNNDGLEC